MSGNASLGNLRVAMTAAVICLFLLAAEPAHASQLHVTYFDLAAVAQQAGIALVATVLSVRLHGARKRVKARVDEVHELPLQDEAVWVDRSDYLPGNEYEFPIYEGVEWTDPNESPIDFRVRGSLAVEELKPEDRVVAVDAFHGWELLPWSSDMERKLHVFFTENGARRYAETTSSGQLQDDLADADWYALAREALIDRKALTPEVILRAARRTLRPYEMLSKHFEPLSHQDRSAFVDAAARSLSADPHPATSRDIIEVIDRYGTTEEYGNAKGQLLMALVKSSPSGTDKERADWFVQRFSAWLPRDQRVLLDDRSEGEFLDWLLSEDPQEREAALSIAKQMTTKRRAELLSRLLWGDRLREEDQSYGEAVASLAVLVPEAASILAPHLRNDRAWRAAATGLVTVGGSAVPSVCSLLDQVENTEIRSRAILVVQLIGPEAGDAAVPALERAWTRANRSGRREIVKALKSIGTPRALKAARRS